MYNLGETENVLKRNFHYNGMAIDLYGIIQNRKSNCPMYANVGVYGNISIRSCFQQIL